MHYSQTGLPHFARLGTSSKGLASSQGRYKQLEAGLDKDHLNKPIYNYPQAEAASSIACRLRSCCSYISAWSGPTPVNRIPACLSRS